MFASAHWIAIHAHHTRCTKVIRVNSPYNDEEDNRVAIDDDALGAWTPWIHRDDGSAEEHGYTHPQHLLDREIPVRRFVQT